MKDTIIKTTIRIPETLHTLLARDGQLNANITRRLQDSVAQDWTLHTMNDSLITSLQLPDVIRLRASNNPHENLQRLAHIITTQTVQAVIIGSNRDKALIAALQLQPFTIIADNLGFILNSPGRAHDIKNFIQALDYTGLLSTTLTTTRPLPCSENQNPHTALDSLAQAPLQPGLPALRALLTQLSPELSQDI